MFGDGGPEGSLGAGRLRRGTKSAPSALPSRHRLRCLGYTTTAERVEGGYRVSGHKQWVTNGRVAGSMIALRPRARVSDGVTAFVVPMDADGISFGARARRWV